MSETVYDAAIVGAGPAGSLCAHDLARAGRSALLIEKAKLPRMKSCAGGIPLKTADLCDFDLSPALDCEVRGGELCLRGGKRIRIEAPRKLGWMVMRDVFDEFLARQAEKAGAELRDGCGFRSFARSNRLFEVELQSGEIVRARVLVGADGANSLVARRAGMKLQTPRGIGIEAEVRVPKEDLDRQGKCATFDILDKPRGYAWIFPKSDHLSIGLFDTAPKNEKITDVLDRFIESQPTLKNYTEMFYREGHFIPMAGPPVGVHAEGVVLVGDAAGLCDSFFGEGIYYAMKSGKLAAEAVDAYMKDGAKDYALLERYSARLNAEVVAGLRWANFFNKTVYRYPDFFYRMVASKRVQRNVAGVVLGNMDFRTCILRTVASAPAWMLGL